MDTVRLYHSDPFSFSLSPVMIKFLLVPRSITEVCHIGKSKTTRSIAGLFQRQVKFDNIAWLEEVLYGRFMVNWKGLSSNTTCRQCGVESTLTKVIVIYPNMLANVLRKSNMLWIAPDCSNLTRVQCEWRGGNLHQIGFVADKAWRTRCQVLLPNTKAFYCVSNPDLLSCSVSQHLMYDLPPTVWSLEMKTLYINVRDRSQLGWFGTLVIACRDSALASLQICKSEIKTYNLESFALHQSKLRLCSWRCSFFGCSVQRMVNEYKRAVGWDNYHIISTHIRRTDLAITQPDVSLHRISHQGP